MYTQAFPWFGTLGLRERVAVQAAVAQYHGYVAAQRDVIVDVKQAYYDLAYVDTALAVTEQEQSLLEHYEQLAQTRFATGQGLQQGVIRLQAEITQVINRLEMLRQQRATLAARLNTLRDRAPETPVPTVAPAARPPVDLDLEALYELGDRYRPELHAGTALIERSERSVALARNASRPNFTVGVGYQNVLGRRDPAGRLMPPPDNGKNPLTVSLGLTIPLWAAKNRASLEQAGEELVAQRHGYAAARNTMEFDVRDAVIRLQTLGDQIALFEQVLIPQTEETLRATEAAYETAQLGVLDLLDSEQMQLDVRLVTARYAADYLAALADLERAIGTTVPQAQ
jgi:outer membrane protein TolC